MNKHFSIIHALLAGLLVLSPLHTVHADNDHIEARRLLNSGEIMPLDDILKIVRQAFPGKLLEVELEIEDKQIVYEIEILNADGIVKEIYINAKTGKIISTHDD